MIIKERKISVQVDNNDWWHWFVSRDLTHRTSPDIAKLEGAWAPPNNPYDEDFMERLKGFAKSMPTLDIDRGHMWTDLSRPHRFIFEWLALDEFQKVHDHLNLMHQSPIMHLISSSWGDYETLRRNPEVGEATLLKIWDALLSVCEYAGILPKQNVEQGPNFLNIPVDTLVDALDLTPPKFAGGYYCLKTSRGLFADRQLMALYAALRVDKEYGGFKRRNVDMPIVEIGGGGGYVAYWLGQLGYKNITMIDLPSVLMCQAYQLGANYGNNNITLPHENTNNQFKFQTPEQFYEDVNTKYEVAINCDSFGEMGDRLLRDYIRQLDHRCNKIFSMNQENGYGQNRVLLDVLKYNREEQGTIEHTSRSMCWVREGYTDDWFVTKSDTPLTSLYVGK